MSKIDDVLAKLNGPRETFLEILTDTEGLLEKVCSYASRTADEEGVEPWVIISRMTHHGSGISSAIYELYREDVSQYPKMEKRG